MNCNYSALKKMVSIVLCMGLSAQGFSYSSRQIDHGASKLAVPVGYDNTMTNALKNGSAGESANQIKEKNYRDLLEIFGQNEMNLEQYIEKCAKKKQMDQTDIVIGMFGANMSPSDFDIKTKDQQDEKPLILAFGGGTGLLASIKPLHILGAQVRSVQCSVDDGGSTYQMISDFIANGMGWLPSLGDLMSSLFKGFATEDKLYKLLDDQGRVALTENGKIKYIHEDNTIEECKSLRELVVKLLKRNVEYIIGNKKGVGYAEKITVLSDDFVYFASSVLNLVDIVEKKYINEGRVKLKGASIRNVLLVGAMDRAGLIDTENPLYLDADADVQRTPLLRERKNAEMFQNVLDKLGEMADISSGKVSLSHNEPVTIYCKYMDNVIIIDDGVKKGKTDLHAIAVRKIVTDDRVKIEVRVPERNYELHNLDRKEQVHKLKIGSLTIFMKVDQNDNFNFSIDNENEYTTLYEPENIEDSYVKYLDIDHRLSTDGTGMVRFQDNETIKYQPLSLSGRKVYVRSRFATNQTHITETVNVSKITDFGVVEIKDWETVRNRDNEDEIRPLYRPLPEKKIPANNDIITAINDPETKGIIFGPGSFFTSLLPHLMVEGLPEALRKRRQKGDIPIVFSMNPTIDNETFNFSIGDILKFAYKKTGIKMDDMFTDMVVNKFDTTKLEQDMAININTENTHMSAVWYVEKYRENPRIIDKLGLGYMRDLVRYYIDTTKAGHADPRNDHFEIFNNNRKPLELVRDGKRIEETILSQHEYLEGKIQELLDTLYKKPKLDIRTDPSAGSKEAKKSHGPMAYGKNEIERIKSLYPRMNIYRDIFLGGVDFVPTRNPDDPPDKRIGFIVDYTSYLLGELFGLDTMNRIITRQFDCVVKELKNEVEDFESADEDFQIEEIFYTYPSRLFEKFQDEDEVDADKQEDLVKYFGQIGLDGFKYIIKRHHMSESFRVLVKDEDFEEQNSLATIVKDESGNLIIKKGTTPLERDQKEQLERVLNVLIERLNRDDVKKFAVAVTSDPEILENMGGCVIEANLGKTISKDYAEETVFIHPYFFMLENFEKQIELFYHAYVSHILNRERDEERASMDTNRFRIAPVALAFYRKAESLKADYKHEQALSLLHAAHELLTYATITDKDQKMIINSLKAEVQVHIEELVQNPQHELNKRKLQLVNENNGRFIINEQNIEGVHWVQGHEEGIWHANSQVLVIDQKGRIWIQQRRDEHGRKDISVTGHMLEGMGTYLQVALRRLTSEMGIASPRRRALVELRDLKGKRKIGTNTYAGESWCHYNEEEDIFYSVSKEKNNREYTKLFLYVLNDRELKSTESSSIGKVMQKAMGFQLYEFNELINEVKDNPRHFASSALQFFHSDENVEIIKREVHNAYVKELDWIEKKQYLVSREYLNNIKDSAKKIIAQRNTWFNDKLEPLRLKSDEVEKRKARANNEIDEMFKRCLLLTTWNRLVSTYKNGSRAYGKTIDPKDVREVLSLYHDVFGNTAETPQGRAILHALLRLGAKLIVDGNKLIFKIKNKELTGVTIDSNGRLVISKKIADGIDTIRRGAIAADLDFIMAFRDKNIDPEIWRHINELRMMGIVYAVVSANKYEKQYNRALTDLLNPLLQSDFLIYANGAGVKATYDEIMRKYVVDQTYSKSLSKEQVTKVVDGVLTDITAIWEEVIREIRNNSKMLADKNEHEKLKKKIGERLKINSSKINTRLQNKYGIDVIKGIYVAMDMILADMHNVLVVQFAAILEEYKNELKDQLTETEFETLEMILNNNFYDDTIANKLAVFLENREAKQDINNKKKIAYLRNLAQQLDINVDENDIKEKNWPWVDRRSIADSDNLIQVTIKPIYPAKRQLSSNNDSAREILGGLVKKIITEMNRILKKSKPLEITFGGSTSIDVMRRGVNKAAAVNDLIKNYHLSKNRDLVLAIDDEMDPTGVGFSFLKAKGIMFISGEDRKGQGRRMYKESIKVTDWFWGGDFNWEPELETTKNTFFLLEKLYLEEVKNMFLKRSDYKAKPVLRLLKIKLNKLKKNNVRKAASLRKPKQAATKLSAMSN